MIYYYDTEFIEGHHNPVFGKRRHFIDLISIGIVAEDGREYYAISNEFDVDQVWNTWRLKPVHGDQKNRFPDGIKEYWLRDNVLLPLVYELAQWDYKEKGAYMMTAPVKDWVEFIKHGRNWERTWRKRTKELVKKYCKSNKRIATELDVYFDLITNPEDITLYGYYADYDHVLLCSLFGKMIDLPKGMPKYTRDLKQMYDEIQARSEHQRIAIKSHREYPRETNAHNALADARWNKQLHNYLKTL